MLRSTNSPLRYSSKRISDDQDEEYQSIRVSEYQENKAVNKENRSVAGFEKLWIWQKAYKLMQFIHKSCKALPREEKYRLKDQVERSSFSVCDNIAEGYTAYYYKDKIERFLTARKEAGETQNHILKLSGKNYIKPEVARRWVKKYEEVIRGINGYVNYIRDKRGTRR